MVKRLNDSSGPYLPGTVPPIDGYYRPDFFRPLDPDVYLRAIPDDAQVKGLLLMGILAEIDAIGRRAPLRRSYRSQDLVSCREYAAFVVQAAAILYPMFPLREGIRRVGRLAHRSLVKSPVGRVLQRSVSKKPASLPKLVKQAHNLASNHGRIEVTGLDPTEYDVRYSDCYVFLESYGTGMLEGLLETAGLQPSIRIRRHTRIDATFRVSWPRQAGTRT